MFLNLNDIFHTKMQGCGASSCKLVHLAQPQRMKLYQRTWYWHFWLFAEQKRGEMADLKQAKIIVFLVFAGNYFSGTFLLRTTWEFSTGLIYKLLQIEQMALTNDKTNISGFCEPLPLYRRFFFSDFGSIRTRACRFYFRQSQQN